MADDLIHCPSCGFQLRLPTELYGTPVECPQCHAQFTAPAPTARPAANRPPPGREYDASVAPVADEYLSDRPSSNLRVTALKAPAIALIALAGLAAFQGLLSAIRAEKTVADFRELANDKDLPPELRDFVQQIGKNLTVDLVVRSGLFIAGLSLITVLGGIQMLRVRTYWLAVIGAILGLNPFSGPCCIAQVPIAIWALVVLFRSDVRMAFR